MRISTIIGLFASSALLVACNTVRGVGSDIASVADAFDPNKNYTACSGPIDADADGRISTSEWNAYQTSGYASWDVNHDGRISRAEYANCWYGGGFYPKYNRATWQPSYSAFDTNHDGWLSSQEYWNAAVWAQYDRNHDGVLDASEWPW